MLCVSSQDLALLSTCDDYDNATLEYDREPDGRIWRIKHLRQLNMKLTHDCQVTVTVEVSGGHSVEAGISKTNTNRKPVSKPASESAPGYKFGDITKKGLRALNPFG